MFVQHFVKFDGVNVNGGTRLSMKQVSRSRMQPRGSTTPTCNRVQDDRRPAIEEEIINTAYFRPSKCAAVLWAVQVRRWLLGSIAAVAAGAAASQLPARRAGCSAARPAAAPADPRSPTASAAAAATSRRCRYVLGLGAPAAEPADP
jgi:hypothetical protein